MKRVDHETAKDGLYTEGDPPTVPPTVITAGALNHLQEELARAIEAFGRALDPDSYDQLTDTLRDLQRFPLQHSNSAMEGLIDTLSEDLGELTDAEVMALDNERIDWDTDVVVDLSYQRGHIDGGVLEEEE